MNSRHTLCLLLLPSLLAVGSCSNDGDDAAPRAKHLLFISVDTLRRDRLGCYGGPNKPSPNIDRLAEEGTLFQNAFTSRGMTLPSFTTFFTSKYPTQHGVIDNLKQIPGREVTLAERLKGAGFHNRAFNASGVLRPGRGNVEQGYDKDAYTYIDDDRQISARAEFYLRKKFGKGDRREYLWVHFMEPHKPYSPPSSYATLFTDPDYAGPYDGDETLDQIYVDQLELSDADRKHIEGLYDGTIAFVDDCIGRILAALEDSGQAEDTLVVFASDHGEELGSHNKYYYHANSIYAATTSLAFIARQPGSVTSQKISGLVENTDFMPTVLSWLGVDPAAGGGSAGDMEGLDLSAVLRGQGSVERDFSIAFTGLYDFDEETGEAQGIFSARNKDWHYVSNPHERYPGYPPAGRDYFIPKEQLFHVAEDPDEQVDRSAEPGHEKARAALQSAIAVFKARYVDKAIELPDSMTIEKIEEFIQLGYIEFDDGQAMIENMKRMRTDSDSEPAPPIIEDDGGDEDREGDEDHEDDC